MSIDNDPTMRTSENNSGTELNRRDLIKLGTGALLGAGAAVASSLLEKANQPDASCENIPVPTGHSTFDVYGNKTDSNELVRDGYAKAVRQEECRQQDD